MPRKYQQKRRLEEQAKTRQRIVEAAVDLHQTVGGRQATISAIAARAGVERLTVYRHFPDERSLITACTTHYAAQHPLPDPAPWQAIVDPETRLQTALTAVYAYHRETEQMSLQAARDLEEFPVLREVLAPVVAYWERVGEMLGAGWTTDGACARRVDASVGHALRFQTWHSLVREQGLSDAEAVDLMVGLVGCAARVAGEGGGLAG
jgi:AcrR family transcriptional regulator